MSTAVATAASVVVNTWQRAERHISVGSAARKLGVTRQHVWAMLKAGKIPGARRRAYGGWWEIPYSWVEAQRPKAQGFKRHDDQSG